MSQHDRYISPFSTRYSSDEMQYIFSDDNKFRTWRRLWVALARAEMKQGLTNITPEMVAELEAHVDDINYDVAIAREKLVRHDVMSHVYAYGQQCPKAAGIIHLGATSCYVGDNTDIIVMRQGLELIRKKLIGVLAKLAHGLADDMLTTTVLACRCPKLAAPAMNTAMYENPVTQDNLAALRRYGWEVVEPASGYLACGAVGKGKLPEPEVLLQVILHDLAHEKDMMGKKVLVTAGPTQEALDPVRYLTNHSTGKMGYAVAYRAMLRGAEVTLVTGPTAIEPPPFVKVVPVATAEGMFQTVTARAPRQDAVIMAAAVADYRPTEVASEKKKKQDGDASIPLTRTKDILAHLGAHKPEHQFLCGFSMETEHMLENSRAKLKKKNLDMIVANNLKVAGAGFGTDTNVVTMIRENKETELPIMSKEEVAGAILDEIFEIKR